MPQLAENKQNEPVLIANFEPNHCARKSAQKVKGLRRRHCADEPAQKVESFIRRKGQRVRGARLSGFAAEGDEQGCSVRAAEAGAGVPARAGGIGAVGAAGDVVKSGGAFGGIQQRIHVADIFPQRLIDPREQAGPERRYGAGSTDDGGASIYDDVVAGLGVRVSGDVRHAAADKTAGRFRHAGLLLIGWKGKKSADSAAGCAFASGKLVPGNFSGDFRARQSQPRAAATDDVRTGRRKIDVGRVVGGTVGRAAIAGSSEDGDAHGSGVLAGRAERIHRLLRPGAFRAAPTDGNDRGAIRRVMDGGGQRVEKALVGVGGEINGDLRGGSDGADNFDIEFHFAVGAVRIAGGGIRAAINRDNRNFGLRNFEAGKIFCEVGGIISAAQFQDSHALAGAVRSGRKIVSLRDNQRSVRNICGLRADFAGCIVIFAAAEMSLRLRAVIEAEDAFDDAFERGGNLKRPGAAAVVALCVLVATELHAESLAERSHGAAQKNGAARGAFGNDLQTVLRSERANFGDVFGARTVLGFKRFAGKILAVLGSSCAEAVERRERGWRRASAKKDGDFDALVGVRRTDLARARKFGAGAGFQFDAILLFGHDVSLGRDQLYPRLELRCAALRGNFPAS